MCSALLADKSSYLCHHKVNIKTNTEMQWLWIKVLLCTCVVTSYQEALGSNLLGSFWVAFLLCWAHWWFWIALCFVCFCVLSLDIHGVERVSVTITVKSKFKRKCCYTWTSVNALLSHLRLLTLHLCHSTEQKIYYTIWAAPVSMQCLFSAVSD